MMVVAKILTTVVCGYACVATIVTGIITSTATSVRGIIIIFATTATIMTIMAVA